MTNKYRKFYESGKIIVGQIPIIIIQMNWKKKI